MGVYFLDLGEGGVRSRKVLKDGASLQGELTPRSDSYRQKDAMVHKDLWKDVKEEALSVESCTCCIDTLPFGPLMIVGVRLVRLGNGGSWREQPHLHHT